MRNHGWNRGLGVAAAIAIAIGTVGLGASSAAAQSTPTLSLSLNARGRVRVNWSLDNGGSRTKTSLEIERKVEQSADTTPATLVLWHRKSTPQPTGFSTDTNARAGKGTFSYRARVTVRGDVSEWSPVVTMSFGGGPPTTDEWPLGPGQSYCDAGTNEEVLNIVNAERANVGKAPMVEDERLDRAARRHGIEMITRDEFTHKFRDGTEPWEFFTWAGYVSTIGLGQNIARDYATPAAVMAGWMNSTGHRENILSTIYAFEGIGIGCIKGPDGTKWWTQDFG